MGIATGGKAVKYYFLTYQFKVNNLICHSRTVLVYKEKYKRAPKETFEGNRYLSCKAAGTGVQNCKEAGAEALHSTDKLQKFKPGYLFKYP